MIRRHSSRSAAAAALLVASASVLALVQGTGALAVPVDVTVTVTTAITLTITDDSIDLTGAPGQTVQDLATVSMNVQSNNPTGYNITVTPTTPDLDGAVTVGTIPATALSVRSATIGSTVTSYTALTLTALTIFSQATPSIPAGDVISNDYQVAIPQGTPPDVYTGVLDYIAINNP